MSARMLRLPLQFFGEQEDDFVIGGGEEDTTGTQSTFTPPNATPKDDKDTWLNKNGLLRERDWYVSNGLDPDRDYQDTASMLNYEYQTSMANYGQNAERLFQMGLSNSGVSDIFQANAFSAYLSNMNDANINRINSKKQNKLLYDEYVRGKEAEYEEYSAAWDANRQTNLNNAITYALENYNGYNLEDVIKMLGVQGYDQGILDDVRSRIGALSADQYQGATALSLAETIFTLMPNYSGSAEDQETLKTMLGSAVNADALTAAINIANAKVSTSTDSTGTDGVTLTMPDGTTTTLTTEENKTVIGLADAFLNSLGEDEVYVPETDEYALRDFLRRSGVTDERIVQGVIKEMILRSDALQNTINNRLDKNADDTVSEIKNTDAKDFTSAIYDTDLKDAEEKYGKDSDNYQKIVKAGSAKTIENLNWMLEQNPDGTPKRLSSLEVGVMLGYDEDAWNSMEAGAQEAAIMEYAGNQRSEGKLTDNDYYTFVSTYVTGEVGQFIETDKGNAQATGLQSAGGLVSQLLDWKNKGYLTEAEYNSQVSGIISQMKFEINDYQINWYGAVKGAEASLMFWEDSGTFVNDEKILSELNKASEQGNTFVSLDGKLYRFNRDRYAAEKTWKEIEVDDYTIVGDGVSNSEAQREGIYEILVALLTPSYNPKVQPESGGESTSAATSGGYGGGGSRVTQKIKE